MSVRHRPRSEREQLELFRALSGDLAPRDAQDLMAYPFFSLAKTHRTTPIDFRLGEVSIRVEAVAELVAVITELRPHVVETYDPDGGYGHPDHIQTHRVTIAGIAGAADRWRVPKFYWTVMTTSTFRAGVEALGPGDIFEDWTWPADDDVPFAFADDRITSVIDAPEHLPAKVAALGAHATQMTLGPTGRAFALSNKVTLPVLSREYYVLVTGQPGVTDDNGWETDLLSGIDAADD